tara:strand:+ start:75 stop:992 length:918 start_codon:yes stop_codon:yes gene_type:complete
MFEFGKYFNKQVTHDSNSEINKLTNHIKTKIGKWQVLHSPSKNFLWIKNAKVAGTSMYRGVLEKEIHDILSYKKNPEEFDKWWDSLTDEKINDYFKFVFVRNPFDRCVSAFSHIVMESVLQDHYNVWPVIHPGKKYDRNELRLEFDAIYKLWTLFAKRALYDYDINGESVHWMPQNVLVECDGEVFVDFIGKYENLENDWKKISNKLKVSDVLPRVPVAQTERQNPNTDRAQRQNLHWSQFYVDLELIDSCAEFYFRDLELFEYKDKIIELTQRAFVIREELQKQRNERGTKLEQNLRIDINKDK